MKKLIAPLIMLLLLISAVDLYALSKSFDKASESIIWNTYLDKAKDDGSVKPFYDNFSLSFSTKKDKIDIANQLYTLQFYQETWRSFSWENIDKVIFVIDGEKFSFELIYLGAQIGTIEYKILQNKNSITWGFLNKLANSKTAEFHVGKTKSSFNKDMRTHLKEFMAEINRNKITTVQEIKEPNQAEITKLEQERDITVAKKNAKRLKDLHQMSKKHADVEILAWSWTQTSDHYTVVEGMVKNLTNRGSKPKTAEFLY